MSWIYLSHELQESTPSYGGAKGFSILERRTIRAASSSRAQTWRFPNHLGTHVDFPAHFARAGKTLSDYAARDFVFARTVFIEHKAVPGQLIENSGFRWPNLSRCEFLILKTGFEKRRSRAEYIFNGPGLHPEFCRELRRRAPQLRAIGFDFISLTSYVHRELGREAHRILLADRRAILIVEDMKLTALQRPPRQILIAPLQVKDCDGAPVTVLARTKNV